MVVNGGLSHARRKSFCSDLRHIRSKSLPLNRSRPPMSPDNEISRDAARQALLRAVCDQPDDDAPRLRYADHLDAVSGDALRAEYIRMQCELARPDLPGERWLALQDRKAELESDLDRWAAVLPQLAGVRWNSVTFPRGFVWDVWCDDADAYRRHAADIFTSAPIQSVSFMTLKAVRPVVEVPQTARLRRLILEGFRLTPSDAASLADSPTAKGLTALHLSGNRFGDAGAIAIAASPHLRQLDNLDLGDNRVGDDGVAALAMSPVVASLTHLGLPGNPITNEGASALAGSRYLDRLMGLTLWGCNKIATKGKKALKDRFGDRVSFAD